MVDRTPDQAAADLAHERESMGDALAYWSGQLRAGGKDLKTLWTVLEDMSEDLLHDPIAYDPFCLNPEHQKTPQHCDCTRAEQIDLARKQVRGIDRCQKNET